MQVFVEHRLQAAGRAVVQNCLPVHIIRQQPVEQLGRLAPVEQGPHTAGQHHGGAPVSLRRDPADLRSVLPRRPEIAASVFLNINATGRMSDGHDAGDTAALYSANDGVLSDEAVAEELGLISWLI